MYLPLRLSQCGKESLITLSLTGEKVHRTLTIVKTVNGHESLFRKVETTACVMNSERKKKQSSPKIFHTIPSVRYTVREPLANALPHSGWKRDV